MPSSTGKPIFIIDWGDKTHNESNFSIPIN